MERLSGKVAIVTGAGSGIGEASAKLFAAEGARVAVAARTVESAERVRAEIAAGGGQAIAVHGDAGDEDAIRGMVAATHRAWGRIDVLYSNAGLTNGAFLARDRGVADMEAELWDRTLRVNLTGSALFAKHVIPHMIGQGGGSILFSGSARGSQGDMLYSAYAASKAGMISLSQNIAAQHGKQGIRSNILVIGMVLTPAAEAAFPEPLRGIMARHHLTPYFGAPGDVARMALFLASDDARFVTGQQILIDGGLLSHSAAFADTRDLTAGPPEA